MGLLEDLKHQVLIGDGAMGTLLYSYGIDRCFEELNVSKPEEIKRIHEAYVQAGAHIIQTNTYGANYIKLSRHGLEDETKKSIKKQSKSRVPRLAERMCSGRWAASAPLTKMRTALRKLKEAFGNSFISCCTKSRTDSFWKPIMILKKHRKS